MTIDEAMHQLEVLRDIQERLGATTALEAIQLGIEALKQLKEERRQMVGFWRDRLPGETPSTPTPEQAKAARGDTE